MDMSDGMTASGNRYLDAVAGRALDRPPVWLMRQAGRYLPEYRELRSRVGFQDAIADPSVATELTLQPMQRFRLDAAIVFADIMTPLEGMGISMTFDPGPRLDKPVRSATELGQFDASTVESTLETLGQVRAALPRERAVIGFCGAPFTLAAYAVEGSGTRDFLTARAMALDPASGFDSILAVLADAMADYLVAQLVAGADAVQLFDSWVGLVSRETYRDLVRPSLERLLARMDGQGPVTYFAPNATHLLDLSGSLPVNVVSVDWRLPIVEAWQAIGSREDAHLNHPSSRRSIQGNLDPATLLAGPDATAAATRRILGLVGGSPGHIFNLGHGLTPDTPVESVDALVDAVVGWPDHVGEIDITEESR
ncbi:MAG: uroporphyrinogen decarboxylase [Actinobacteria bacterium ATB1]|nr:uroporphyrinogen decarboxylase [Actinobacteria bacterium ATB1]